MRVGYPKSAINGHSAFSPKRAKLVELAPQAHIFSHRAADLGADGKFIACNSVHASFPTKFTPQRKLTAKPGRKHAHKWKKGVRGRGYGKRNLA